MLRILPPVMTALAMSSLVAAPGMAQGEGYDEDWRQAVAQRAPAFTSAFVDEDGVLQLRVTDMSSTVVEQVRQALIEVGGDEFAVERMEVQRVSYSHRDLGAWYARIADDLWALPGIVMSGIDDTSATLLVGVTSLAEHEDAVADLMARENVPRNAVSIIEVTGPVSDPLVVTQVPKVGIVTTLLVICLAAALLRQRRVGAA